MGVWVLIVERQEMQSIERFVADRLAAWEVPGCAVVAVQDGQVVLAAGWGQRDLDTKLGDQSHLFPLMFLSDPDGDITALTVPFEPLIEPQRFDRRPDASARDPEILRRLCGDLIVAAIAALG
ncbi:MAG: hypothetical protein ACRDOA_00840 [Streptosporangiaceae bacterium]